MTMASIGMCEHLIAQIPWFPSSQIQQFWAEQQCWVAWQGCERKWHIFHPKRFKVKPRHCNGRFQMWSEGLSNEAGNHHENAIVMKSGSLVAIQVFIGLASSTCSKYRMHRLVFNCVTPGSEACRERIPMRSSWWLWGMITISRWCNPPSVVNRRTRKSCQPA